MKSFTLIGGPNGSGKTTLTNELRKFYDFGLYINPDEYSVRLRIETPELTQYEADLIAQNEAKRERYSALNGNKSFAYETVMSHDSHLDFMLEARTKGFHINFYFVSTSDPRINIDRVAMRVETGGHSVPTEKIISRYARAHKLLPGAMLLADKGQVWDNSRTSAEVRCLGQTDYDGDTWRELPQAMENNWFTRAHDEYLACLSFTPVQEDAYAFFRSLKKLD